MGIPASLKTAWFQVEFGNFTRAATALKKAGKSRKPDTKQGARKLLDYVEGKMNKQIEAAKAAERTGRFGRPTATTRTRPSVSRATNFPGTSPQRAKSFGTKKALKAGLTALRILAAARKKLGGKSVSARKAGFRKAGTAGRQAVGHAGRTGSPAAHRRTEQAVAHTRQPTPIWPASSWCASRCGSSIHGVHPAVPVLGPRAPSGSSQRLTTSARVRLEIKQLAPRLVEKVHQFPAIVRTIVTNSVSCRIAPCRVGVDVGSRCPVAPSRPGNEIASRTGRVRAGQFQHAGPTSMCWHSPPISPGRITARAQAIRDPQDQVVHRPFWLWP
ncbi:MAG: hypothetical protein Ct9H300mP1_10150 [Planctomycetaceae bacterium]|nr:MAG: hypothetical protein Ct9H300mP1_10150 [Planctomycetaceae bacterium]